MVARIKVVRAKAFTSYVCGDLAVWAGESMTEQQDKDQSRSGQPQPGSRDADQRGKHRRRSVVKRSPNEIEYAFLCAVFERKQLLSLWGQKSYHTPCVIDKAFGDGQQLIYLTTINGRPNYYVVRIDSRWNVNEGIHEKIDIIEEYISEQFGYTDSYDDDEEPLEFPALDPSGSMWGVITWSSVLDDAYRLGILPKLRFTRW